MTVWTILVITMLDGTPIGEVLYVSQQACERSARVVSDTLSYDHALTCQPTGVVSYSVAPQPNPRRQS
jgi:hypothetical protein